MLSEWKHEPLTQPDDPSIIHIRKKPSQFILGHLSNSEPTKDERLHTCFYYAIKQTTGLKTPLFNFWSGSRFITTIDIEDYFKQTKEPVHKGLAVYTTSKDDLTINHFAEIIINEEKKLLLRAKWGMWPLITTGDPFLTPSSYGTAIGFFDLKKEYKSDNKLLHKAICRDAIKKTLLQAMVLGAPLAAFCFVGLSYIIG